MNDRETFLVQEISKMASNGTHQCVGAVAALGMHRRGVDLERPEVDREYESLEAAMQGAMDDLASEGMIPMIGDSVLQSALEFTPKIEDAIGVDADEPGGLVEDVDSSGVTA